MKREIILMLIRHGLSAVGVLLMARGKLTKEDADTFVEMGSVIAGALFTISALSWSAARKVERAQRATLPATGPTFRSGGAPNH